MSKLKKRINFMKGSDKNAVEIQEREIFPMKQTDVLECLWKTSRMWHTWMRWRAFRRRNKIKIMECQGDKPNVEFGWNIRNMREEEEILEGWVHRQILESQWGQTEEIRLYLLTMTFFLKQEPHTVSSHTPTKTKTGQYRAWLSGKENECRDQFSRSEVVSSQIG